MARVYVTRVGDKPNEGARLLWGVLEKVGSQLALGRELGITNGAIGRWLRGEQRPSTPYRVSLVAYGIPLGAWDAPPKRPLRLSAHAS